MSQYYTKETKGIPSTGRDIKILIYHPVKNKKPKEKLRGFYGFMVAGV